MVKGIIYIITNQVNTKQYVGYTKTHKKTEGIWYRYGIAQRFSEHVGASKRRKTPIAKAIASLGANMFTIEELERCQLEDVEVREAFYIQSAIL